MASTLGTVQPFRYRGYVYDEETRLYYLKERYYSHENARWISAEPNVYAGGFDGCSGLVQFSVYTYCANNWFSLVFIHIVQTILLLIRIRQASLSFPRC
ncbi:MAG: RHS repeat-associated core domain-containing protein [Aristaeellaceae bacterium]